MNNGKKSVLVGLGLLLLGTAPVVQAKTKSSNKTTIQKVYQDDTYVSGKAGSGIAFKVLNGKKVLGQSTVENKKYRIKLNGKLTEVKNLRLQAILKNGKKQTKIVKVHQLKNNKIQSVEVLVSSNLGYRPAKNCGVEVAVNGSAYDTKGEVRGLKYLDHNYYGQRSYLSSSNKNILKRGKKVSVKIWDKHYKTKIVTSPVFEFINNRDYYHDGDFKLIALRDLHILKNGPVIKKNTKFTYIHHYNNPSSDIRHRETAKDLKILQNELIQINYHGKNYQIKPLKAKTSKRNAFEKILRQHNLQIEQLVKNFKNIVTQGEWLNGFSYEGLFKDDSTVVNSTMKPSKYITNGGVTKWYQYAYKHGKLYKVATYKGNDDGKWTKVINWN